MKNAYPTNCYSFNEFIATIFTEYSVYLSTLVAKHIYCIVLAFGFAKSIKYFMTCVARIDNHSSHFFNWKA